MSERTTYQEDSYWYSKISDYRTCPALFKAKHIDKSIKTEPGLDLEFGTAMHLGINNILEGGDGYDLFEMYWDTVPKTLHTFRYNWIQLKDMAKILLPRFKRLHAKNFKPFMMEERMFAELEGHLIEGTPDFLGDYKGVASIIDFKTSSSRYAAEKIIAEEQLTGYAYMAEQTLGYKAVQKVYVVFIKHQDKPSIQIIAQDLYNYTNSSIMDNMKATIEEIKSNTTYIKNISNCVRGPIVCPNFKVCWSKNE